jgi:hypothetical protein
MATLLMPLFDNGYFCIFLYTWILKQKSVLRRSKQAANLVEKHGGFVTETPHCPKILGGGGAVVKLGDNLPPGSWLE